MRKFYVFILLLANGQSVFSQNKEVGNEWVVGPYSVGYMDTIVFNKTEEYVFEDYSGPKPYFINIWYPADDTGIEAIHYKDMLSYNSPIIIKGLADTIRSNQLSSVLNYGLLENLDTDEIPKYGNELLELVLESKVGAINTLPVQHKKFPALIYHHGNGGVPFENNVLFEYLASHGFAVIAAYYHWPKQEAHTYPEALEDVEFMAKISSALAYVDSSQLFYLGHSWGGGVALRMNQRNSVNFKKYLIYDSSIEHYELQELAFLYPKLDSLIRNHGKELKTKTVVFSARATYLQEGKRVVNPYPAYKPYQFFEQELFTYYTLKEPLNHGQFTSLGIMRAPYSNKFKFTDSVSLASQYHIYKYLVTLTKDILLEQPLMGESYIEFKMK
jgi:pimeloyl-ACP methyl ester carboxylesterase